MSVERWIGEGNPIAIDIFKKKYLQGQEFDIFLERVSGGNKAIEELIVQKKFLFGGRILANRNLNTKGSINNCYSIGYAPDDYEGLMDVAKNLGLTYKAQGGQGVSMSKLRPKGAPIGSHYKSDGIVPFMRIFNEVTSSTSQGGSRKGALMISVDARHKEAMDFITLKSENGIIEKANLSLEIDDLFMEAVQKYYETGERVVLHEKRSYSGHDIEYDIVPIDIYLKLVHNSWDWGDPACLFTDEFRTYNIMEFDDDYQIETCNPSLRKGTQILTQDGIFPIETLEGKTFLVKTLDEKWAPAECFLSGRDKELYKITLDNKEEYYCTAEHKWPILTNAGYQKVQTQDLLVGSRFAFTSSDLLSNGEQGSYEDGLFFGFWYGDGSKTIRKDDGASQYGFTFGEGSKQSDMMPFITSYVSNITKNSFIPILRNRGEKDWYEASSRDKKLQAHFEEFGVLSKDEFPIDLLTSKSENFRRGFVDGLLSSDGTVANTGKSAGVSFITSNKKHANAFSSLLYWYGIKNNIYTSIRDAKVNGHEYKDYKNYTVNISFGNMDRFSSLFHLTAKDKQDKVDMMPLPQRDLVTRKTIQVVAVEKTDLKEDVWDIHVHDESHTFRLNHCITGNCGEQPLAKDAACCLGSNNLSEFVVDPFTPEARFDMASFLGAVGTGVIALDEVIDDGMPLHAIESQRQMAFNYRNIGLGVMGYADMLIKLGLKYGSPEAIQLTEQIFYAQFRQAVFTSASRAKKLGSFPKFKPVVFDSRIMKAHFSEEELVELKKGGLRNCSLISIAPTGSLAVVLDISGGGEPMYAIKFTRRTIGATDGNDTYYDVYCKIAQDYMKHSGKSTLPDYFVSSSDINWEDRVMTQAAMQRHVDTAISSTINLPESATYEDIEGLYLLAWQNKIKGITIFRDNCKKIGVLTKGSAKDTNKEQSARAYNKGTVFTELPRGSIQRVPEDLTYRKYTISSGCGKLYLFVGVDEYEGKIYDVFTNTDGVGGCTINTQGNSRLISACIRGGIPLEYVVEQLSKSGTCASFQYSRGKGKELSPGKSCLSAIALILKDIMRELHDDNIEPSDESIDFDSDLLAEIQKENVFYDEKRGNKCPECGEYNVTMDGGCTTCRNCGWSACS